MQEPKIMLVAATARYLVVAKPAGLPTVPLASRGREASLLALVGTSYPEVLSPLGRHAHEGTVLHRLDTDTCGLVLFARDAHAYELLQEAQNAGRFIKHYVAAVEHRTPPEGFPPFRQQVSDGVPYRLESRFRAYGAGRTAVRPVTDDSPPFVQAKGGKKRYRTAVAEGGVNCEGNALRLCMIEQGFRHQIRCHLAWASTPIVGDRLYGSGGEGPLHLAAVAIEFPDPDTLHIVRVAWERPPGWATPTSTRQDTV